MSFMDKIMAALIILATIGAYMATGYLWWVVIKPPFLNEEIALEIGKTGCLLFTATSSLVMVGIAVYIVRWWNRHSLA